VVNTTTISIEVGHGHSMDEQICDLCLSFFANWGGNGKGGKDGDGDDEGGESGVEKEVVERFLKTRRE
jgi:hypothetical protein